MPPTEILKDLFFIERGYLNGNHFVYRAKEPILIDTGYIADFDETARAIASLGVKLSDVRLIINTHTHCDHIGGNRIIQEKSGCGIALHEIGKHFIDTRDSWSTWWTYFGQEADFFDCTISLNDGDVVALGPHEFRVIHTPGHASDGIVLYNQKHKILISSDTLWEWDMAIITIRVEGSTSVFNMQTSLEKLARLDVKVVYPGHGKPFTDVKSALAKSKKKIEDYLNDRRLIGLDILKKIIVYTLLERREIHARSFFAQLMNTPWFKETVDLYFNGAYEEKYSETMADFLKRNVVKLENGTYTTTVKP
ncbi:MBL fold metallo-hydrolase [Thermodesulfobacteriota bacterium]